MKPLEIISIIEELREKFWNASPVHSDVSFVAVENRIAEVAGYDVESEEGWNKLRDDLLAGGYKIFDMP